MAKSTWHPKWPWMTSEEPGELIRRLKRIPNCVEVEWGLNDVSGVQCFTVTASFSGGYSRTYVPSSP